MRRRTTLAVTLRAVAGGAAYSFEQKMQAQAHAPAIALAQLVNTTPEWSSLEPLFHKLAEPLIAQVRSFCVRAVRGGQGRGEPLIAQVRAFRFAFGVGD